VAKSLKDVGIAIKENWHSVLPVDFQNFLRRNDWFDLTKLHKSHYYYAADIDVNYAENTKRQLKDDLKLDALMSLKREELNDLNLLLDKLSKISNYEENRVPTF
jgi:hypothetical protein